MTLSDAASLINHTGETMQRIKPILAIGVVAGTVQGHVALRREPQV
jgi:hypothetical protein